MSKTPLRFAREIAIAVLRARSKHFKATDGLGTARPNRSVCCFRTQWPVVPVAYPGWCAAGRRRPCTRGRSGWRAPPPTRSSSCRSPSWGPCPTRGRRTKGQAREQGACVRSHHGGNNATTGWVALLQSVPRGRYVK
jgi:hypothetical protein